MKPLIYIESTVVSYLTARPIRDVVALARQQITQAWWERDLLRYRPVISQLVLDEVSRGDPEASRRRCEVLTGLPLLGTTPEAIQLARRFIRPDALPSKAKDDALHLALCAVHGIPYLLTWSFRHLANPMNRRTLEAICLARGCDCPTICTPDEMLKGTL